MVHLQTLVAVVVLTMLSLAAAFPNQPGACRLSGMKSATNPHGFAPSVMTDQTFMVAVQPSGTPNTYTIMMSGTGTFTGLLLFAQDSANGTRFGSFTNIPSGYAPLTTCGDINPASNTLGHNSATPKTLPVSFTWTDLGYPQPWTAVFSGIVMTSNITQWFTTAPVIFASTGTGMSSSTPPMMSTSTGAMPSGATTSPAGGGMSSSTMPSGMSSSMMNSSMTSSNSMMMNSTATGSMQNSPMASTPVASQAVSTTSAATVPNSSARLSVSLVLGLVIAAFVVALS